MTPGPTVRSFLVEDSEASGSRLDLFVARSADLSRTQAATLIANGHVTVDGRREKASYRVQTGENVGVEIPPPTSREVLSEAIQLNVVFEDDDVLVVDKPAGMVVHPAPGHWSGTLVNALKGRGGPLSEGTLVGDSVVCPWHHSRFALEDGRVLDGPAVHPQPCLETRVRDGQIEVRKPPCKTMHPIPAAKPS